MKLSPGIAVNSSKTPASASVGMPSTRHFVVATAGHVDHGKSSLIKALTGIDPDRLPEEKARSITLDLGFAHLQLSADERSDTLLDVGIVDVPGHEDFVKNMIAGAGSIDLALFVVASDDGWMPQTEEHLQILNYLGVNRAVVVMTKTDIADPENSGTLLREKLIGSPFECAPIIPTSVVTGQGLEQLKQTMARVLATTPALPDIGKPRLPIDRAFVLQGVGTVVTGTLRGGCLHKDQEVVIQPTGQATRIRAIQTHNKEVEFAAPGSRVALNVPNASVAGGKRSAAAEPVVQRGCIVTVAELGSSCAACDLLLERSCREPIENGPSKRPLRDGTRVRFHIGSCNVPGRVFLFKTRELYPGECSLAQIRLESPVYAFAGDRFVLRDWSERMTWCGGVVLNPVARQKRGRGAAWQSILGAAVASSPALDPATCIEAQIQENRVMKKESLAVQSNFSRDEVEAALSTLNRAGKCVVLSDFVFHPDSWKILDQHVRNLIDEFHKSHPNQEGLSLAQLRSSVSSRLPLPGAFEPLLSHLLRSGFSQIGSVIARASHRPILPPQLQAARAHIERELAIKPFEPPSRKELASDGFRQEALAFLLRIGAVVELDREVVLTRKSFAHASELICQFLREHGPATVSELRQVLCSSRRVVVPLLEKLDREGVTRRQGDKRCLRA